MCSHIRTRSSPTYARTALAIQDITGLPFGGFARIEKLRRYWSRYTSGTGIIPILGFKEHNVTFHRDGYILVLFTRAINPYESDGDLWSRLVTERATSAEVAYVHDRQPLIRTKDGLGRIIREYVGTT